MRSGATVRWCLDSDEPGELARAFIRFDPGVLPRAAAPADEFTVRRLGDRRLGDSWYLLPADQAENG